MMKRLILAISTKNDRNGNARRLSLVVDPDTGQALEITTEHVQTGPGDVRFESSIEVTPSEFQRLKTWGRYVHIRERERTSQQERLLSGTRSGRS